MKTIRTERQQPLISALRGSHKMGSKKIVPPKSYVEMRPKRAVALVDMFEDITNIYSRKTSSRASEEKSLMCLDQFIEGTRRNRPPVRPPQQHQFYGLSRIQEQKEEKEEERQEMGRKGHIKAITARTRHSNSKNQSYLNQFEAPSRISIDVFQLLLRSKKCKSSLSGRKRAA